MGRWDSAVRWLRTPAVPMSPAGRRFFRVMSVVGPFGAAFHLAFIPFFWWLGAPDFSAYNVGSSAIWIALYFLFRGGRFALAVPIAVLELWVQAFLSVHAAGWQLGFQYMLFLAISTSFQVPLKRVLILVLASAHSVVLALLYFYSLRHAPVWIVPPAVLAAVGVLNLLIACMLQALVAFFYLDAVDTAEAELAREHQKSEGLLHNVLPASIAERLKGSPATIADGFPGASILFADLVGFTTLSATLPPERIVQMLDEIFSRLDGLVRKHGVEKIKTIGDAYMAAAGVPVARPDHAEALARLALDIQDVVADYNRAEGTTLSLRIGLHSGAVVAGVIGKTRFLYDLWGDTVNTASRMESHGVPGEVQVSETTAELLRGKFALVERGVVDVKGKGPMRTWFLRRLAASGAL